MSQTSDSATETGVATGTFNATSVLVVEDEALVALDLEDMLLDIGFKDVVLCNSIEAAEITLSDRSFSYMVFDLNLDGKSSVPLIEKVLGSDVRIVVASGYDAKSVELPDPSIPRITKPYRFAELQQALFQNDTDI